jgi:hypothetical protein
VKVYKLEVYVVDHDDSGLDGYVETLEDIENVMVMGKRTVDAVSLPDDPSREDFRDLFRKGQ